MVTKPTSHGRCVTTVGEAHSRLPNSASIITPWPRASMMSSRGVMTWRDAAINKVSGLRCNLFATHRSRGTPRHRGRRKCRRASINLTLDTHSGNRRIFLSRGNRIIHPGFSISPHSEGAQGAENGRGEGWECLKLSKTQPSVHKFVQSICDDATQSTAPPFEIFLNVHRKQYGSTESAPFIRSGRRALMATPTHRC